MKIYKIIYNDDVNNFDIVTDVQRLQKTKDHPAMVMARLVATSEEYISVFQSIPEIKFYSSRVFSRAVPMNRKELGTLVSAKTKTTLFDKILGLTS